MKSLAYFALFCLRIFLVTISCEAWFNFMKLRQNESNSSLSDSKLDSAFIYQNASLRRLRTVLPAAPLAFSPPLTTNALAFLRNGHLNCKGARGLQEEQRAQEMAQPAKARAHGAEEGSARQPLLQCRSGVMGLVFDLHYK